MRQSGDYFLQMTFRDLQLWVSRSKKVPSSVKPQ